MVHGFEVRTSGTNDNNNNNTMRVSTGDVVVRSPMGAKTTTQAKNDLFVRLPTKVSITCKFTLEIYAYSLFKIKFLTRKRRCAVLN